MTYEVIVLGLGGIGSAIAERLSRKYSVLGLEQFSPVHDLGSSHGETRAIRKAYFEDPRYVPLTLRAYELWAEQELAAETQLLTKSGCVIMGAETSPVLQGCLASAKRFTLDHELFDAAELERRYGFRILKQTRGFFEADGGYLKVEACVAAFHKRALKNGAILKFNSPLLEWRESENGFEVTTEGEIFRSRKLVVALGAWTKKFADELPLQPKRALQYWFEASGGENLPVYFQDVGQWIYGFPKIGETIKVAFHNPLNACDPATMDRSISSDEIDLISPLAHQLLPHLGAFARAKTCLYNMTPDENFVVGRRGNVILATGFSGHGFKFAPVIGEMVEELFNGGEEFELFGPSRFTN